MIESQNEIIEFQPPCCVQGHQPLDRAAQSHIQPGLECLQDGVSTTSLGSLFQCITILWVKHFFLISNLNLPCPTLKPFPLVLSLSTLINSRTNVSLQQLLTPNTHIFPIKASVRVELNSHLLEHTPAFANKSAIRTT